MGYHFDLQRGLVFPTQKKLGQLKVQTVCIRKSLVLTPRKLMSLIGILASLEKTVQLGRLHMRPFQWYLKSHCKFPQSLNKRIPVTGNFLKHLKWWEDLQNLMAGAPIHHVHNTLVFTDVSQKGWGAHLNEIVLSGLWSNKEDQLHINALELKAVLLALKSLQYGSILSEQGRNHTFHRNVCSYLENSGIQKFQKDPDKSKTCTWIPKCDSRLPIMKGQGHTNRVIPSPTDIQPNLQS